MTGAIGTVRLGALAPLLCGLAVACGTGRGDVALEPRASDATVASAPVAVAAPLPTAEDSLADLAALEALHDIGFTSLAKGAEHVRGVMPAPTVTGFDDELGGGSRGGPASAAAPTYDIDVESFAQRARVRYYVDYFLGPARERFTIWLGRLPRYEGMIRDRFRTHGVPEDLVYLAIIESGYSNTAVSRRNAVGMWQFIASTGRGYGLSVSAWVDERRDPFRATEAAARHLSDLYGRFGSWYLAAAAYNGGAGRVERGIRRLSAADSVTDETFFDLSDRRYLRRETRDYVPKLIAAAIIAKDPLRYGFDSLPILQPLVYDEITVPDATGLDVLARLADTTVRAMVELNPQYVRGATPPRRTSIVRVPRGTGTKVAQRYAELPANERVNFIEHVVRRGETLSEISERYRVSVRLLRAANNNVHPRRLRIGMRLVIPISPAARSNAAAGRAPRPRAAVSGVRYHRVRRGETLWIVAQRYGVTVEQLRRWNGMAAYETLLRVGEELAVVPPRGGTR
jgi:membrane-bound lytic murein transglycosylase D